MEALTQGLADLPTMSSSEFKDACSTFAGNGTFTKLTEKFQSDTARKPSEDDAVQISSSGAPASTEASSIDDSKPEFPGSCCWCSKQGVTSRCAGCKGAPLADGSYHQPPLYCGRACQAAHWAAHKTECKQHQASKRKQALQRAGALLKKLFLIWREGCYDRPLVKVERKDNSIYLYENYKINTTYEGGRHYCLQGSLFSESGDKEAVLCNMGCDIFLAFLSSVLELVLNGVSSNIQEIEIMIKNRVRPIYLVDTDHKFCQLQGPHHVLKAQLKSGESYAIDITGAQFGWDDVVMPWSEYFSKHCQKIKTSEPLGGRRSYYDGVMKRSEILPKGLRSMVIWTHKMGEVFAEIVHEWFEDYDTKVSGLLSLPDEEYTRRASAFLLYVETEWRLAAEEGDRAWGKQPILAE